MLANIDTSKLTEVIKIIVMLVLFGTVVLCAWRGFKDGIIRSLCGIVAVFIALYFGGIVAKMYNNEFIGMLDPFVSGITEATVNKVTSSDSKKDTKIIVKLSDKEKTSVYSVCYASSRQLGFCEDAAKMMAEEMDKECIAVNNNMIEKFAEKLSIKFSYVALYALSFAIIAIALTVVINVINVSFKIPKLGVIEPILGTLLGIFRGILLMYAIAMFLRYLGIIVPNEIIAESKWVYKVVNENKLAPKRGL